MPGIDPYYSYPARYIQPSATGPTTAIRSRVFVDLTGARIRKSGCHGGEQTLQDALSHFRQLIICEMPRTLHVVC